MSHASWPAPPEDFGAAVRDLKKELRARIGDVEGFFARIEDVMRREIADIEATKARGESVWPVVQFSDIAAGTVPADTVEAIHRRGCLVVIDDTWREKADGPWLGKGPLAVPWALRNGWTSTFQPEGYRAVVLELQEDYYDLHRRVGRVVRRTARRVLAA